MKKLALILAIALVLAFPAFAEEQTVVKLGLVGIDNEQWDPVIAKLAEEGVTLELVTFSDYSQPNRALADGEIDLNSFQHYAFLNNQIADLGYELTPIGETFLAPYCLYSKKITSVDEIKEGDKIAIANDATNGGRGLKVIEAAGLITVDPEAGYLPEISDIIDNPLNLEFVEADAAMIPSLLADVAAGMVNVTHAAANDLYPREDAIYLEQAVGDVFNPYINIIVARTEDAENELYLRVVEYFRTDEVKQLIDELYRGGLIPAW